MAYLNMNKNIFLCFISIFFFTFNLCHSETAKAKTNLIHTIYSDITSFPNYLIKILTAKQYFIIKTNIDKIIEYRLLKIKQLTQNEIRKQSIENIKITKKNNSLIIFYKNIQDSTKILNIIKSLSKNILNSAELKNELINNQLQMTLTIPTQNIKKELNLKSKSIIQSILLINNIQATVLPMTSNKFFIIPLKGKKIDSPLLFQDIDKTTFHLVNENFSPYNTPSTDTIFLPFLFSADQKIPIYKHPIMDGQSIINTYSKFNPYLQTYPVYIIFDSTDKKLLQITSQNIRKTIAIVMNDKIIFAPRIMAPIYNGKTVVEENFSAQQGKAIANLLSLNYLPITFKITEIQRPILSYK